MQLAWGTLHVVDVVDVMDRKINFSYKRDKRWNNMSYDASIKYFMELQGKIDSLYALINSQSERKIIQEQYKDLKFFVKNEYLQYKNVLLTHEFGKFVSPALADLHTKSFRPSVNSSVDTIKRAVDDAKIYITYYISSASR